MGVERGRLERGRLEPGWVVGEESSEWCAWREVIVPGR
jgi:hypothetical protein